MVKFVVKWSMTSLWVREVWDSISGPVKTSARRHRCEVSLELCCPGAEPRRWIPPLVTRFSVIPRISRLIGSRDMGINPSPNVFVNRPAKTSFEFDHGKGLAVSF